MKWLDNFIVSKGGQWEHPGELTAVPTDNGIITMDGVPYPLFAMDETGYGGMIYPGGNYQFRGKMVYEIPMAKDGYMLPGRFRNPEGNWLTKYQGDTEGSQVKPTFLLPKEEQEKYLSSLQNRESSDPMDIALDAASFVPGPIGMGASAIGFGKNLQEGDYTGAVLDAANVLTAGAAKYFNWAKGAAKSAGASRVARSMADKADFLEKASNPNIYKTIGLGRDLYNYSYPESESKYFTTEDDYNFAKPSTTDVKKPGLPIKPLILKGNGGDISIPDLSRPNWLDKAQKGKQVKYYDDLKEFNKAKEIHNDSLSDYLKNKYIYESYSGAGGVFKETYDEMAELAEKNKRDYGWAKSNYPQKPQVEPVYKEKPKEYIPTKTPRLEREPLQLVMPQSDRTLMPYNNTRQVLRGIQKEDKSNENLYPTRVVPAPDFRHGGWLDKYQDGSEVVQQGPELNQVNIVGEKPNVFKQAWNNFERSRFNPLNLFVDDLSAISQEKAFNLARQEGMLDYMHNGKKYTTKMDWLTPQEQLEQTGITDDQLHRRGFFEKRLSSNLEPLGYQMDDQSQFDRFWNAAIKNQKDLDREKRDLGIEDPDASPAEGNNRTDAYNLYTGLPQKYNTFSISKYKPSRAKDNDVIYYSINDLSNDKDFKRRIVNDYRDNQNAIDQIIKEKNWSDDKLAYLKKRYDINFDRQRTNEGLNPSSGINDKGMPSIFGRAFYSGMELSKNDKEKLKAFLRDIGETSIANDIDNIIKNNYVTEASLASQFGLELEADPISEKINKIYNNIILPLESYDPKTKSYNLMDSRAGIMGNYNLSKGIDPETGREYLSYRDVWDIDPVDFGKPFEIYDRIYFDDPDLIVPQQKHGGAHKWLDRYQGDKGSSQVERRDPNQPFFPSATEAGTYESQYSLPEASVTPNWTEAELERNRLRDKYIADDKKAFRHWYDKLGYDKDNVTKRANQFAYNKLAKQYLKGDKDKLTEEQRKFIEKSEYANRLQPSIGSRFVEGVTNPGFNLETLGNLAAPFEYPANLVRGAVKGEFTDALKGQTPSPYFVSSDLAGTSPTEAAIASGLVDVGVDTGIGAFDPTSLSKGVKAAAQNADRVIYPTRAYRAEGIGANARNARKAMFTDKESQVYDTLVGKKDKIATKSLDEFQQYLIGNKGKSGLLNNEDMLVTEFKVPFWKKPVTENKEFVNFKKKVQKLEPNPNEYIIPGKTFLDRLLYPRRENVIKGAPKNLTDPFIEGHYPLSYHSSVFTEPGYKYIEDQIAAVTGHDIPLYKADIRADHPRFNWQQPQFAPRQGIGSFKFYKSNQLPSSPNSMGPGPMMLGLPNYTHEVKNVDYFKKMLDSYGSNKLSNQSKQYFQGIIKSVEKQEGLATKKQYDMLQRLRTGDFNYGKKEYGGWLEQYQDGSQVPANFFWIDQDGQFRDVPIPVPPPKTFEEKVDDFLGNPQEKAMNLNRRINNDNLRHSAASMHTTESLGSTLGAAILAQGLGAAHEISSLPKRIQDTKTDDVGYYNNIYHNVIESGEDVFNNAIGSMVGMIPFIPTKAKESLLVYLSNNNMLPDGKSMPEGNEYVPKKKSGGWLDNY